MKRNSATALLVATTASSAWCAPPLATDDATTLLPGMCQFELEQRRYGDRVERDAVSVCNLWFDTEFGIGHQRVSPTGAATGRAVNSLEQFGIRQNYANAILMRQVGGTALHANLGLVFDREADADMRRARLSWAIAVEDEATSRWTVVAELFGQRGALQSAQLGLRWWAVPKYVQFTASLGTQRSIGSDGRRISVGIRFETPDLAH